MIKYRIKGNIRLERAKQLLLSCMRDGDVVADIGCGIGMISEAAGKRYPNARVVGVDISHKNIAYAKRTIKLGNVTFFRSDITEQFSILKSFSPNGYNIIALFDVIEHIPETDRKNIFSKIKKISKKDSLLIITYPNPEYIKFVKRNQTEELQIIDNVIEINQICIEAGAYGWDLRAFEKKDAWYKDQYIHCVFERIYDYQLIKIYDKFLTRLIRGTLTRLYRPYRIWYYKTRILRNK
ncbi:class I SAM-dependent methyltransferase [Oricola cellulosilytica]|uniref:Class I SAM-dependent methyltransferase n=1 Tax=Oricola cellulosilytica TaxID=1429082 RepID=A0A4R0PCE1_9HYPH|nr:class I SAM-dependent methyltransferase [Oricola cellulosilytica]TCD15130.1 class I SAM-dependent methyltransferase [Oricola cellulosilytica]